MGFVKKITRKSYCLYKKCRDVAYRRFSCQYGFPTLKRYIPRGFKTAIHVSAFTYGNVGDALLPVVLRDLFNNQIGIRRWIHKQTSMVVDDNDIIQYNKQDFMVIGGGGLFLKDTNPNDLSGWQWSCSIDKLSAIKVPIIMFAVGYNRFRGQDDFEPVFTEHINAFVKQAVFVGLRNHGSIEKLKNYLKTDDLKEKLVFQPCMTTLVSKVYPNYVDYSDKEDFIAFNCAFDRQGMRSLGENRLDDIAKVALELSKITTIKYYSHMPSDNQILPYFDKYSVPYELVEMKTVESIVKNYSKPQLVIGMRGHAQMIPFGCHTPILSIVSHDKMQWFLDDIHHPEWGVDVLSDDFGSCLLTKALDFYENYHKRMDEIIIEQDNLWRITIKNLKRIKSLINSY